MLAEAHVYYANGRGGESSSEILFETDNERSAIIDAKMWHENRNLNLPECFGRLLCMKIYEVVPQRVRNDGYLLPGTGFPIYEWKCDWGLPYGE